MMQAQNLYTENLKLGRRTYALNSNRAISRKRRLIQTSKPIAIGLYVHRRIRCSICEYTGVLRLLTTLVWTIQTKQSPKRQPLVHQQCNSYTENNLVVWKELVSKRLWLRRGVKYANIKFCQVSHNFDYLEGTFDLQQNVRSSGMSWWFVKPQPTGI